MRAHLVSLVLPFAFFSGVLGACSTSGERVETRGTTTDSLRAVCVEPGQTAPAGAWICGDEKTIECASHAGAQIDAIYVPSVVPCSDTELVLSSYGPFPTGVSTVGVKVTTARGTTACTSRLAVVDTVAPSIRSSEATTLWPPNHSLHRFTPRDCVAVTDTCDGSPRVFFTFVTSDEASDGSGDGKTSQDIVDLDCDSVELRAERSGNADGRVYTLGVRAVDASGNSADGSCTVVVAHDQGKKVARDSGKVTRVQAPASCPRAALD